MPNPHTQTHKYVFNYSLTKPPHMFSYVHRKYNPCTTRIVKNFTLYIYIYINTKVISSGAKRTSCYIYGTDVAVSSFHKLSDAFHIAPCAPHIKSCFQCVCVCAPHAIVCSLLIMDGADAELMRAPMVVFSSARARCYQITSIPASL